MPSSLPPGYVIEPAQQQAPPQQAPGVIYGRPRPPTPLQQSAEARANAAAERDAERLRMAQAAAAQQGNPNATYQERFDRLRADKDIGRIERASEVAQMGLAMEDSANQAQYWLDNGADTGFLGDFRMQAGRALGGQTSPLENFNRVAATMALDNVGKLKGPLSDKDIAFLKSTVVDVNSSPQANREAVRAQQWAARRAAAYEAALQEWSRKLGRPSALNAQGLSFDRWWGQYAQENLPQPGGANRPARPQPSTRQPSAQERALAARFESDKRRIASLASRPRPGTPARPPAARVNSGNGWRVVEEN
jgi:hypothetical protein